MRQQPFTLLDAKGLHVQRRTHGKRFGLPHDMDARQKTAHPLQHVRVIQLRRTATPAGTDAEGKAAKVVQLKIPLVVRLEGTNVESGKEILRQSGLPLLPADNLREAAQKAITAARGKS